MLAILNLYQKQQQRQELDNFILSVMESEEAISPDLYEDVVNMLDRDEAERIVDDYAAQTRSYNLQQQGLARTLIADLPVGVLKHHSIHCLSFRECMSTVIGLDMVGFSNLFYSLRAPLAILFPQCPETLNENETHRNCERRLKLFLCLYRLKQGVTFQQMEVTFGWSSSSLQEWFDLVLRMLVKQMMQFHEGFLDFKGPQWQRREAAKWWHKHVDEGNMEEYYEKVAFQNTESRRGGHGDTINADDFIGSIGAVDGTYSVQPAVGRATLLAHNSDPLQDLMWSEYKRCHAYKVMVVMSHGLNNEPKFLLWVQSGAGSASDAALYSKFAPHLKEILFKGIALLGDHAFHGALNVIAPYTTAQIRASIGTGKAGFNRNHSSDRMTSEHGVRALKLWGVARGREDSQLFQNQAYFDLALKAVWALHNYKASGCPVF
jgi:hypothetical protein